MKPITVLPLTCIWDAQLFTSVAFEVGRGALPAQEKTRIDTGIYNQRSCELKVINSSQESVT